ncbi:hypothetical protein Fleli_2283 [Bernardetia litoralis DSM 6794]|uniref:DUF4230 domain-containing protein n=1 Tax=Bernardetia litoralis (strain ATCC 23117 / DSM 6794 / NBRC 15988 / NCIMB 1366 / Fx l1 / Sio-4) TaxID=880071 RepID=I4AL23_BERLS|nr:DUF4230 domain-containing protein [Bernardetia litoralis]AFM04658.1 hypothetical protein Fleli_2283 [Bernardetia litoralis DSM 6794]
MTNFIKSLTGLLLVLLIGFGLYYITIRKDTQELLKPRETITETNFKTVLEEVESLGKLELVKYNFKDVVEHTQKNGYSSVLDSKVLLIVAGEAVGCMDLTRIKNENITEVGDSVYVHLPAPELCYSRIDLQKSKVYDSESLPFIQDDNLVGEAFAKAEKQIEKAALESGILIQTQAMAKTMLKPLLENLTKKTVILTFEPISTSEKTNPESQTNVQEKNILNTPTTIQSKNLDKK